MLLQHTCYRHECCSSTHAISARYQCTSPLIHRLVTRSLALAESAPETQSPPARASYQFDEEAAAAADYYTRQRMASVHTRVTSAIAKPLVSTVWIHIYQTDTHKTNREGATEAAAAAARGKGGGGGTGRGRKPGKRQREHRLPVWGLTQALYMPVALAVPLQAQPLRWAETATLTQLRAPQQTILSNATSVCA